MAQSIKSWASTGALIAAGAIGTELLAEGAVEWWRNRRKEKERGPIFEKIIKAHPELKDFPYEKVIQYFETLYTFSPGLSKDPLAAGAFIRQALRMDEFGGPSHETIKNLADIEKKQVEIADKSRISFKSVGIWGKADAPFGP